MYHNVCPLGLIRR